MHYPCVRFFSFSICLASLLNIQLGCSLEQALAEPLSGRVQLNELNRSTTTPEAPASVDLTTMRTHGYEFSQGSDWGYLDFTTFIPEPSLRPSTILDPRTRFAAGIDDIMKDLLVDSAHPVKIMRDIFDPNATYSQSVWLHGPLAYRLGRQHKALIELTVNAQGNISTRVIESNLPGDLAEKLIESIKLLASTKKEQDELTNYWNIPKPVSVTVRLTFPKSSQLL